MWLLVYNILLPKCFLTDLALLRNFWGSHQNVPGKLQSIMKTHKWAEWSFILVQLRQEPQNSEKNTLTRFVTKSLEQNMLKVLKCFSRTKTLDEYYLPPLNGLKGSQLLVNTHKPAESGAECGKCICSTTERLRQIFFMTEVTESSALWQFLMGKMFQSYLDSESWMMIFSGVNLANAWTFLGWIIIITGNVQRDAAIVEVVHMARSWGWECRGPCKIKLTQCSSWRSRTAVVDDIWNHLLLSLITTIVIIETLRISMSHDILDLAFWYSGTFQLLCDSLSGTNYGWQSSSLDINQSEVSFASFSSQCCRLCFSQLAFS